MSADDAARSSKLETDRLIRELAVDAYRSGNRMGLDLIAELKGRGGKRVGGGQPSFDQTIMKMLIERGLQPPADPTDQLVKLMEMERILKEGSGTSSQEHGMFAQVLAAAASIFAQSPAVQQMIGRTGQSITPVYPTPTPTPPVPTMLESMPAPAPLGAGGDTPQGHDMAQIPQNAFSPGQILDHLENDEPSEFAAWLLSQPYGGELAAALGNGDPELILQSLTEQVQQPLARLHPQYHVAVWLVQHPDRAIAVAVAIRQQMAAGHRVVPDDSRRAMGF